MPPRGAHSDQFTDAERAAIRQARQNDLSHGAHRGSSLVELASKTADFLLGPNWVQEAINGAPQGEKVGVVAKAAQAVLRVAARRSERRREKIRTTRREQRKRAAVRKEYQQSRERGEALPSERRQEQQPALEKSTINVNQPGDETVRNWVKDTRQRIEQRAAEQGQAPPTQERRPPDRTQSY